MSVVSAALPRCRCPSAGTGCEVCSLVPIASGDGPATTLGQPTFADALNDLTRALERFKRRQDHRHLYARYNRKGVR